MTQAKKDPLLSVSKAFICVLQAFAIIGMAALAIGAAIVLIFQNAVLAEIAPAYPDVSAIFPYLLAAFMLGILPLLAMLWLQLNRLRAIVGTVDEGNPFVRINGERLRFIAILIFVQQFAVFLFLPLIVAMQSAVGRYAGTGDNDIHNIEFEISLTTLLLALLLVILGRVFEQGADMREELEGTV